MGNDDSEDTVVEVIAKGGKVITVKDRFDNIEKRMNWLTVGIGLLLFIHLSEVQPYVAALLKFL